jgi:hypothetical protein
MSRNSYLNLNLEYKSQFYSSYLGFVVSVTDVKKQNGILVYVPEVFGIGSKPVWAEAKGVYGGRGYGMQNLPQKDDTVWVSFRYGNPNNPLWEHGYYAKNEKPSDFDDEKIKGLITPDGTKLIIDGKKITALNANSYGIEIDESVILGKTDADKQPAALGNEVKDLLEELANLLNTELPKGTNQGGTVTYVTLTSSLESFKAKLDNLKSQSVQID